MENRPSINRRFVIQPGARIRQPLQNGACIHCSNSNKENYCAGLDDACDKVLYCWLFHPRAE